MRVAAAIRPATPAHLAGIAALLVATFAPELDGVERASRLAEDATGLRHRLADNLLLVATPDDSEDVVGCVEVYTPAYLSRVAPDVEASKLRPYVASLCVQPEHRGRGSAARWWRRRSTRRARSRRSSTCRSRCGTRPRSRCTSGAASRRSASRKEMQVMLSRDLSPPPLDLPPPPPPPPPPYARTAPPRCCAPSRAAVALDGAHRRGGGLRRRPRRAARTAARGARTFGTRC